MDVFLIGNGFDLHYCLPTTYTCFLRTVENISKRLKEGETITSVAQVFGDSNLHNSDRALKCCYDTYGADYDAALDPAHVNKLFGCAEENMWFSYMLNSFDADKGWIDFEKEIGKVISVFSAMLKNAIVGKSVQKVFVAIPSSNKFENRMFRFFNCFYDNQRVRERTYRKGGQNGPLYNDFTYPLLPDYAIEEPFGSGIYTANTPKIVSTLYLSLQQLADMLAAYLSYFVDRPVSQLTQKNKIKTDGMLQKWSWRSTTVISFNYTHTVELLYYRPMHPIQALYYIHGELERPGLDRAGTIILGVNSDETDDDEQVDVTFLPFKKYYQRAFHRTDLQYIDFLSNMISDELHDDYFHLYVIGHSLDITDQEVIRDCFSRAATIHIFYYSPDDLSMKISNLVKIYKKKGFDELRTKKHLQFHPIDRLKETEPLPVTPFPTPPPAIVF